MENLLDVEEDLYEPILAELPIAEVAIKLQLPRHRVDQRMEYLCLKVNKGHRLGVIGRKCDPELYHGILVNALAHKVYSLPVSELSTGIIWQRVRRHEEDPDRCILLE